MIAEDYVSYETAKLLKEKGFNWECIGYYVDYEPNDVKYSFLGETNSTWESRCCSAPTLQMAMKWLREEKEVFITIGFCDYPALHKSEWIPEVCTHESIFDEPSIAYNTYEEACEAAIKYCLKSLI